MAEKYVFEYQMSRDDWLAASADAWNHSHHVEVQARKERRAHVIQVAIIGPMFIALAAFAIGNAPSTAGMYLHGALAGSLIVAIMCWHFFRLSTHRRTVIARIKRSIERFEWGDLIGQLRLTFDEKGVEIQTARASTRSSWSLMHVYPVGRYVAVSHPGRSVVMPLSVMQPEQLPNFFNTINSWQETARQDALSRVTQYLADRSVACPACGYDLRGTQKGACPECGTGITVESLQQPQ
jgi:hypothetical protein